jgi:hypothetical protein
MIQVPPPGCQVSAQLLQIDIGKRGVRAMEIADGSFQNRARTHMISGRFMMKSDRQLNQALEMTTQGLVRRHGAPDVLQSFMGVKKMGAIKEIDTAVNV